MENRVDEKKGRKEKEEASKSKESTKAMVAAWGSDNDSEDDIDYIALMVDDLPESYMEEDIKRLTLRLGKRELNEEQPGVESELKRVKRKLALEQEKTKDIRSRLLQKEHDLERSNRWTQSSQLLSNLTSQTHNITTGLGFDKMTKPPGIRRSTMHLVWQDGALQI
ncbi:uncharacterized protein LOC132066510 [Lycium ferocissimum]|uniref:uncharacterized protein LOC132066510 n=1 Tax=Lycium ferocissimum TaxID=112874 RepID=UPI0028161091|nr:uncharacterized protein LOC132066510 [Lycium ferocissimum]